MKSVFICVFLALAKCGFAATVCDQQIPDSSELIVSCVGDKMLKYPNYGDMATYYTCVGGQPQLNRCPANKHFCYYLQKCTDCSSFIAPPDCEFFVERTNSKCSSKGTTTKPTKPTTTAPTTVSPDVPTKTPPTPSTPPTTTDKLVKVTPPGPTIPTPPMVVTPVPGVPTPPHENVTPPNIPGTPPMLTTVQSV